MMMSNLCYIKLIVINIFQKVIELIPVRGNILEKSELFKTL